MEPAYARAAHDDDANFDLYIRRSHPSTLYPYTTTFEYYPRSPGQHVPRLDDIVYRNGPVFIWNQAHSVVVQLQYSLYRVEYFAKCRVTVPYLGFLVFLPIRS